VLPYSFSVPKSSSSYDQGRSEPPNLSFELIALIFHLSEMDLIKYFTLSIIIFILGIWGILLNRRNILIMLMSIELMLLAVNLNFLLFSVSLDDMMGQVFALLVLTVAAAESAIGLAIFVITFRVRGTIAVEFINCIQG
jgi:NADH-ubiquinone oxidoreductase chain 4L